MKIKIRHSMMITDALLKRVRQNEVNFTSYFSKATNESMGLNRTAWSDKQQSWIIEALLIGMPIGSMYMDITNESDWGIIDGRQRMIALSRFMVEKNLKLVGLRYLTELEGMDYHGLTRSQSRGIEESEASVYLVDKNVPMTLKKQLYRQTNT